MFALKHTLEAYGYQTRVCVIPNSQSHIRLTGQIIDLIEEFDNEENLFIVYYIDTAEWRVRGEPNGSLNIIQPFDTIHKMLSFGGLTFRSCFNCPSPTCCIC